MIAAARPLDKEVSALVALVVSEVTELIRLLISDARPVDKDVSALVALVVSVTKPVDNNVAVEITLETDEDN